MSDKDKAQQDALNICNRQVQPTNDLILQNLLLKNYKSASLHYKQMQEQMKDLGKQLQILFK